MRASRPGAALVIISAGVLTFGLVFTLLQVSRSEAASGEPAAAAPREVVALVAASESLSPAVQAGQIGVGVPTAGFEALLREVQPGDRLDMLASLPSPVDSRPVTAVVVRGATVLRPLTAGDPLLLEVPVSDALVVAHLVLGGTHVGYVLWPADGTSPSEPQPLDEQRALAILGGSPVASPTPTAEVEPPAAATATPLSIPPSPVPVIASAGFLYQVQPGDTWDSVAATFARSAAVLRQVNEAPADANPTPGSLVFIPRQS